MSLQYTKIKGFADLFGTESYKFFKMESLAREIFTRYCYDELRIPILEMTELYRRTIGDETDVVRKEMFTFNDRKGRSLTMRPEATAGVLRACVEAGMAKRGVISRFFTMGPMFRYERPQKGRQRQFHQINCECLGTASPYADAELICMVWVFLQNLKIKDLKLKYNSLGCRECRPQYEKKLQEYLLNIDENNLCPDCNIRKLKNPLRVLDCKEEKCKQITKDAPDIIFYNCDSCSRHMKVVLNLLKEENIEYEIDTRLVRGLDYYTRTTFEIVSDNIGSQTAVAGGGRYDGLISQLGGEDVPGIGFACGMERLALLMDFTQTPQIDFYLITFSEELRVKGFSLAEKLRKMGFTGEINYDDGSIKSLMRKAAKRNAKFVLIYGQDEAINNHIMIKNMENGNQKIINLENLSADIFREEY